MDRSRVVRVHFRGLLYRRVQAPNFRIVAHWALQFGNNFYEIAAPAEDVKALPLETQDYVGVADEPKSGPESPDGSEEQGDYDAKGQATYDDRGTYKEYTNVVRIKEGKMIPLKISQGVPADFKHRSWKETAKDAWGKIAKRGNVFGLSEKFLTFGEIPLTTGQVEARANAIFDAVFREHYAVLSTNCQAFVCYLLFSITTPDPRTDYQTHYKASCAIYFLWMVILGKAKELNQKPPTVEFLRQAATSDSDLELIEKSTTEIRDSSTVDEVDYALIIPPQTMARLLQPPARPRPEGVHRSHIHRQSPPRSHARHVNQMHHSHWQNQLTMLNATQLNQNMIMNQMIMNQMIINPAMRR